MAAQNNPDIFSLNDSKIEFDFRACYEFFEFIFIYSLRYNLF